jgi:inorganic pyrophosphatase
MKNIYRAHPWHGVDLWTDDSKKIVNVYIEIVPEDRIKYEIDKKSGILKVDRPQKYSNVIPCLYGFLPRTFSGPLSGKLASEKLGKSLKGDEDPVDICVLTDRDFKHGDFLLEAIPIGGMRMIDNDEIDEKVIAVLKNDTTYGDITDLNQLPHRLLDAIKHYFLTYKNFPQDKHQKVSIDEMYDSASAYDVIRAGEEDYEKVPG